MRDAFLKPRTMPAGLTEHDSLRSAMLRLAFKQQPGSLFVALVAALGVASLVSQSSDADIWIWFAGMVVVSIVRLGVHALFMRTDHSDEDAEDVPEHWGRLFGAGQIASGGVWAALSLLWLPEMAPDARYACLIILSALAGGATGVLTPVGNVARAFIGLLLLPPSYIFLVLTPAQPVLALLAVMFFGVMLFCHQNNHQTLREWLSLRAENAQLVRSLTQHSHDMADLTASLENKVAARTNELSLTADTDLLTGLPNRRWMLRYISTQLEAGERLSILLLDLVAFKQINNRLGHEAGDEMLRQVARRFRIALPPEHALARWGGDEFVVVVHRSSGLGSTKQAMRNVRRVLAEPIEIRGEPQQMGVRAGVAVHPLHGDTVQSLLSAADMALTDLKRQPGRLQFLFYRDELAVRQHRRLELAFAVQRARANNELHLVYQPIVSAHDGQVETMEALLRWTHPQLGAVPPDEFIPLVEESAGIITLGAWVMHNACTEAMKWPARSGTGRPPRVAVNVSVLQLLDPRFVRLVADVLTHTGLPAERLELEVTESVFQPAHADRINATLTTLSRMGVAIQIDDFGTGYSSLSRLYELPISAIKIDRSFVARIHTDARVIIESTLLIASRLGVETVAEGVETVEQAAELRRLGVDTLQGYFIGRPQREAQLDQPAPAWINEQATDTAA